MWKKDCNVVMLSTNEKAIDGQFCIGKYEEFALINNIQMQDKLSCGIKVMDGDVKMSYQHLYITSDEKIKEGDWCLDIMNNSLHRAPKDLSLFIKTCKKIITTTNTSLKINTDYKGRRTESIDKITYSESLPKPSQQFIQQYIEEYNKSNVITKVDVEYDWKLSDKEDEKGNLIPRIYLEINPDNTINIKSIKESWNREELFPLFKKALNTQGVYNDKYTNKWIEENL